MITFLPYPNFKLTAMCLDSKRLCKQRIETLQLLRAITTKTGWSNHPAAKMWEKSIGGLALYGIEICSEWIKRGYQDSCREKILPFVMDHQLPTWLGDEEFHRSHRSNLIRKLPSHYRDVLGWNDPDNLAYVWPKL